LFHEVCAAALIRTIIFSEHPYLVSSSWDGTVRRYLVRFEDVWEMTESYLQGLAESGK